MTDEERREMTRSNWAAQMNALGYDESGNALPKMNNKMNYSEPTMDDVFNIITKFLDDHEVYKLMEIITDAIATKEQAD